LNRLAPFRFAYLSAFSVPRSKHPRPSDARSPFRDPLCASLRCGLLPPGRLGNPMMEKRAPLSPSTGPIMCSCLGSMTRSAASTRSRLPSRDGPCGSSNVNTTRACSSGLRLPVIAHRSGVLLSRDIKSRILKTSLKSRTSSSSSVWRRRPATPSRT